MNNNKASLFILTLLLLLHPIAVTADTHTSSTRQTAIAPEKLLFVGNSFTYYNNSLHFHLEQLVKTTMSWETFKTYNFRMTTTSGAYLQEHTANLASLMQNKNWDAVVLQGHSTEAITPKLTAGFRNAAKQLIKTIRKNNAEPVLFMTWAYSSAPGMTEKLQAAYTDLGKELDTLVVPVGLAFSNALHKRPDLTLHARDTKHPAVAGTYLAACTFYAVLYGQTPEGNRYIIDGLSAEDAAFLQKVAWDTVKQNRLSPSR